jgi:hypothetical protein
MTAQTDARYMNGNLVTKSPADEAVALGAAVNHAAFSDDIEAMKRIARTCSDFQTAALFHGWENHADLDAAVEVYSHK